LLAMNDVVIVDRAETWASRFEDYMDDEQEMSKFGGGTDCRSATLQSARTCCLTSASSSAAPSASSCS
ncbi:MAG: hypothetical protein R6U56_01480, partial [Opitutales bacterium]